MLYVLLFIDGFYFEMFLELVAVAAKHKETKLFYMLYNTLDDTKLYLEKEVQTS